MKQNKLVLALGLTASVGLVGCGGGSGSDSSTSDNTGSSTSYSVTAIDGYLKGAQVWLDLNRNFQLDANEPTATSGDGGKASLNVDGIDNPEQYPVVVRAIKGKTVDEDTGNAVATDYVMSAPAGQQDVTPLSTLVHVQLESGQAQDIDAAVQNVAQELGIDESAVLSDYKEDNNEEAAFGARSIVSSGVLPETTEDLATAANDNDGTNELLDTVATVNQKIKAVIEDDVQNLDQVVFNKSGEADIDSDNDGVADSDDAFKDDAQNWSDFDQDGLGDQTLDDDDDGDGHNDDVDALPFNAEEHLDSDLDGKGDNADLDDDNDGTPDTEDAFDFDPTETLDTDGDGTGNNADNDDDGDGVADEDDAFALDPTESVDTDGDNIGNNADPDDDNDGYADEDDAFSLDPEEHLDTDGDGIGNNTDTDDDNDGVEDEADVDPVDPEVGLSDIAKVIEFLQNSGSFYTAWDDEAEDIDQLFIETFTVNGDSASMTQVQRVKSDGSLISIPAGSDSDFQLTSSGWTEVPEQYTIDLSNSDSLTAYPSAYPELTFSASGSLVDLSGKAISDNSFGLELVEDEEVAYPEGAQGAVLKFTPQHDAYYLWTSWKPWVLRGEGATSGADGTSLAEIQVATSIGASAAANSFVGAAIGWDVTVELVTDNTANFYTMNWNDGTATRVASSTWSLQNLHGEEFILFTVPDEALEAWGDKFDQDSEHVLFGVYEGSLHLGTLEKAGVQENDESTLFNSQVKDALLSAVTVPVSKCKTGNDDDGVATLAQFEEAVAACGGATPITREMVIGQNFHRVKGNGDTRDYFFNADGTMDGLGDEPEQWSIQGDYLVVEFQDYGLWYWALVEQSESTWSLKFYETMLSKDGTEEQIIWADTVELNDDVSCSFHGEEGSSLEQFKAKIAAFDECNSGLPETSEQVVVDQTISYFKSNGETRGLQFNSDYSAFNYRNGIPRERTWEINDDGFLVLYYDQEKTEVADYMVLLDDKNDSLKFAFYEPEEHEVWTTTYTNTQLLPPVGDCGTGDTEWNDETDRPVTMASYQDYLDAVEACRTNDKVAFSTEYFDRNITFTSSTTGENDEFETFQFNELAEGQTSGTGKYMTAEDNMDMTWSVDDSTNLVTVTLTDGVATATDTLAIVATDGVSFTLKGFSRATDWDGIDASSDGDIWSHVFQVTSHD
ncbi:hypothetical protein [Vibrio sinaloensis]|uniref:hypothetical protein n=1 Tax=Photobacterium sp. (strain ATCC 43367) TaxID=379097 RepID=UPI0035EB4047